MSGRRRRSGEKPPTPGRSAWAELDVDGRLSAYAQAQRLAAASGVHPRGKEALQRFNVLQAQARVNLAESDTTSRRRSRRWRLPVAVVVVVLLVAAAVLVTLWV